MKFDESDVKTIVISVIGSIVFAVLGYVFSDYWKQRKSKKIEKLRQIEDAKKTEEDINKEVSEIIALLEEGEKHFTDHFFDKALKKCSLILNYKNFNNYPGLYWRVKFLEGRCFFKKHIIENYEENCINALESFFCCLKVSEVSTIDSEADGLIHFDISDAYIAISQVRLMEDNLELSLKHLRIALDLFTQSNSSEALIMEVHARFARVYQDYSTIKDQENYLMLAVESHKKSFKENYYDNHDRFIRTESLALTLLALSKIKDKEKNINEAIGYLLEAAENVSVEKNSDFLAQVQANLATAFSARYDITNDISDIDSAIFYTNESLKIFTKETFPYYYAFNQQNLGSLLVFKLSKMKEVPNDSEIFHGISLIENSMEILNIKEHPLDYAMGKVMLGECYKSIADRKDKQGYLEKAIVSFKTALSIYNSYPELKAKCSKYIAECEEGLKIGP